eukprot:TRINITY_DN1706_c0_g1_i2.p1 TRINITY_DN1706_c0_g1~~TRINITY_DN1706_c0_g1_i2.p1  ORF type:complete len:188 (-),score=30.60 TRINITY_DN1706_c0_g1_i2:41-604(-)
METIVPFPKRVRQVDRSEDHLRIDNPELASEWLQDGLQTTSKLMFAGHEVDRSRHKDYEDRKQYNRKTHYELGTAERPMKSTTKDDYVSLGVPHPSEPFKPRVESDVFNASPYDVDSWKKGMTSVSSQDYAYEADKIDGSAKEQKAKEIEFHRKAHFQVGTEGIFTIIFIPQRLLCNFPKFPPLFFF